MDRRLDIVIPTPIIEDRPRRSGLPENSFAAASLLEWLEIARQAQVRSVPATVVTRLSIDALMEFDQGLGQFRRQIAATAA